MEEALTGVFDSIFHMRVGAFSSVLSGKRIQKPSLGLKSLVCNCHAKLPPFALHGAAASNNRYMLGRRMSLNFILNLFSDIFHEVHVSSPSWCCCIPHGLRI